jgi:hypothetical protein
MQRLGWSSGLIQEFDLAESTQSPIWASVFVRSSFVTRNGADSKRGIVLMKTIADLLALDAAVPAAAHDNPWAIRNPIDEARDLYKMVCCGSCSVAEIRELIAVPKPVEEALLAYAERYPKDGQPIYCVLLFREKVGREFERLLENDPSFAEFQQDVAQSPIDPQFLVN